MVRIQSVPYISKITNTQLWVGSPAVPLSGSDMERSEMLISAVAGNTLFIGSAGVTQANGTPLPVGDQISIPIAGSVFLWGVGSGAGSVDVRIIEWA